MKKQEAKRLRSGTQIIFGDSKWSEKVSHWQHGRVLYVSENGGIKVQETTEAGQPIGEPIWVPYHHVGWVP